MHAINFRADLAALSTSESYRQRFALLLSRLALTASAAATGAAESLVCYAGQQPFPADAPDYCAPQPQLPDDYSPITSAMLASESGSTVFVSDPFHFPLCNDPAACSVESTSTAVSIHYWRDSYARLHARICGRAICSRLPATAMPDITTVAPIIRVFPQLREPLMAAGDELRAFTGRGAVCPSLLESTVLEVMSRPFEPSQWLALSRAAEQHECSAHSIATFLQAATVISACGLHEWEVPAYMADAARTLVSSCVSDFYTPLDSKYDVSGGAPSQEPASKSDKPW